MPSQTNFKIASCLLLAALIPTAYGAEQGKTYIYDAKEADDNRALVIDAVAHSAKIQDKRSVHDVAHLAILAATTTTAAIKCTSA